MWKSKNKLHKTSDLLKFLSLTKLINKYIISTNNMGKRFSNEKFEKDFYYNFINVINTNN